MEQNKLQEMEKVLTCQFLNKDDKRLRAYICSPLNAATDEEFVENMHKARAYMYYAVEHMDMAARAPHAYLPMLLCDRIPNERALALQFDLRLLEESDVLLVCGDRISQGMQGEILRAVFIKARIVAYSEKMYQQILELVKQEGGDQELVCCDESHPFMAGKGS